MDPLLISDAEEDAPRPRKPNVLVFFTDQQRWDTCGCYGDTPMDLTPVLDGLAARGTLVRHSFTVQPVCGPARSCLQTGMYATQTGCWKNGIPLPPDETTLAHYFKEAGYTVGYIGKWHLANTRDEPVPPELRGGYDDFWMGADIVEIFSQPHDLKLYDKDGNLHVRHGYRVDVQTDLALEYLEERSEDPEQPFFLFVSYLEPHQQNDWNRFVAPEGYAERYADPYVPPDLQGLEGDWPQELPDYYGMCKRLDENLGRVLEALARLGLEENTILLFCSDHGCHFRTRNGEYKRSVHESSIRVPTVFAGPGFDRGTIMEELVSLLDWPATLLDAAGIPVPDSMQGRSILPLLDGTAEDWPEEVFIQVSESQVGRGLRTKRWKYGVTAPDKKGTQEPGSDTYVEQYLYDLERDPYERENLAGRAEYREISEGLAQTLKRRMIQAGEAEPAIMPCGESLKAC
ncbi:MAG: sulfatase-like hydrolase/transferase [Armatimonadetes bacterium]|nr:sulfatase-like hydrolase/transferase [Armatimonadota bacterium]